MAPLPLHVGLNTKDLDSSRDVSIKSRMLFSQSERMKKSQTRALSSLGTVQIVLRSNADGIDHSRMFQFVKAPFLNACALTSKVECLIRNKTFLKAKVLLFVRDKGFAAPLNELCSGLLNV